MRRPAAKTILHHFQVICLPERECRLEGVTAKLEDAYESYVRPVLAFFFFFLVFLSPVQRSA